jgi:DNA adenine methylase
MSPKPILKWVGGKTQILNVIFKKFPQNMENYHEPFLGGGSVLFNLLYRIRQGEITVNNIYASDSNEALIGLYVNIQNRYMEFYNDVLYFVEEFRTIERLNGGSRDPQTPEESMFSQESYYYFIRRLYNETTDKTSIRASALFVFLNKTCFRGLYRVGPNGFNVPFGNYRNPEIINLQHLKEIHELIQGVVFNCCDFTTALNLVEYGDFVYLDPPYIPVTKTSFVGYTPDGFDKHETLLESLEKAKYNFLMSNSDSGLIKNRFNYESITAKRNINSKNPGAVVREILVTNLICATSVLDTC